MIPFKEIPSLEKDFIVQSKAFGHPHGFRWSSILMAVGCLLWNDGHLRLQEMEEKSESWKTLNHSLDINSSDNGFDNENKWSFAEQFTLTVFWRDFGRTFSFLRQVVDKWIAFWIPFHPYWTGKLKGDFLKIPDFDRLWTIVEQEVKRLEIARFNLMKTDLTQGLSSWWTKRNKTTWHRSLIKKIVQKFPVISQWKKIIQSKNTVHDLPQETKGLFKNPAKSLARFQTKNSRGKVFTRCSWNFQWFLLSSQNDRSFWPPAPAHCVHSN